MQKRILVVDDESMVAEFIRGRLISFGYEVPVIVESGEEAIAWIAGDRPDLVLMDISLMGAMDGVEAGAIIRERFNIPIVYITGNPDETILDRAKETEPFGFLLKPFQDRELHTCIELALYKHQAENRLRQVEHWFTTTIRSMRDAVIVTDTEGSITLINTAAEEHTGWKHQEANGRRLSEVFCIVDEKTQTQAEDQVVRALREGVVTSLTGAETWLIGRHGTRIPIEGNAASIRDDQGNITGVVLLFRDITQHRMAEAELKAYGEQLRALSARLQSVREEERSRIAREIHDELGQALTGLKIDVSWLAKRLRPDQVALAEKARSVSGQVDGAIQTVRKLATELRPGLLDDLGLTAAIEWQAEEFQARNEIRCHCDLPPEAIQLETTQATAAFRILQETLTNIARHAGATEVHIRLHQSAGNLVLQVQDNGRGITHGEIANPKSLGLLGIRERAIILGGEVKITGASGIGTTLRVSIPLTKDGTGK